MPLSLAFFFISLTSGLFCYNQEDSRVYYTPMKCTKNTDQTIDSNVLKGSAFDEKDITIINYNAQFSLSIGNFSEGTSFNASSITLNNTVSQNENIEEYKFDYCLTKKLTVNSDCSMIGERAAMYFIFNFGYSPTEIYGTVNDLIIACTVYTLEFENRREIMFYGTVKNTNSQYKLRSPQDTASKYIISSLGDKFDGELDLIKRINCSDIYRYYTVPSNDKVFLEIDECPEDMGDIDDFDKFKVRIVFREINSASVVNLCQYSAIIDNVINFQSFRMFGAVTYPDQYVIYNGTSEVYMFYYGFGITNQEMYIFYSPSTTVGHIEITEKKFLDMPLFIFSSSREQSYVQLQTFPKVQLRSILMFVGIDLGVMLGTTQNQQGETIFYVLYTQESGCSIYFVSSLDSYLYCHHCHKGYVLEDRVCKKDEQDLCALYTNKTRECLACQPGYIIKNGDCVETKSEETIKDCKLYSEKGKCSLCEDGFILHNNTCKTNTELHCSKYQSRRCMMCDKGYMLVNDECVKGDNNCYYIHQRCICEVGYKLVDNECILSSNTNSRGEIISCNQTEYYSREDKVCKKCETKFSNCNLCNSQECLKCNDNYKLSGDKECVSVNNCERIENNICLECKNDLFNNKTDCIQLESCLNFNGERCAECENGFILQDNYTCSSEGKPEFCSLVANTMCQSCEDGYYIKNSKCEKCEGNCATCIDSKKCLSCQQGYYLSDTYECVNNKELEKICKQLLVNSQGCAICMDGYYRSGTNCKKCSKECLTCESDSNCLECDRDYFFKTSGVCKSKKLVVGCIGGIDSNEGCLECDKGYYFSDNECYECSEECSTCSQSATECITCSNDNVKIGSMCVSFNLVSHCKGSSDSKCSQCSFWYKPSKEGDSCNRHIRWWIILIGVIFILIIIGIIILIIIYILKKVILFKERRKIRSLLPIFRMKKSDITFSCLNAHLSVNRKEITFGEVSEIPVGVESKTKLCVGNTSKSMLKIQIVMKESYELFKISVEPSLLLLKSGEACEVTINIKPRCTCTIEGQLSIVSVSMKNNEEKCSKIMINCKTEISTKLDYNELEKTEVIGEGAFGCVYLGYFRGNVVAIKEMKEGKEFMANTKEEFKKEVAMLEKFKCDYIVHFFGSCRYQHVCIVLEFAKYGSVHYIMEKKAKPLSMYLRVKFLRDAAKGIEYLHNNGILHRDIKPHNILVFTLDSDLEVNAKLTDFGSSRNINMLMTNMTFTRGVGTPVYMAPEILRKEHYKKPTDIYSFAVTMFEIIKWGPCYSQFKYPWSIADFIVKGNRAEKPKEIPDELFQIIDESWKDNPKDRLNISQIVNRLEENIPRYIKKNK